MSRSPARKSQPGPALVASASNAFNQVRKEVEARPWWYNALLVIGFVTLLTAVAMLFFGVGRSPQNVVTSAEPAPVQTPEFAVALARLVGAPIERGGTIEMLKNGDEFVPALLQALDGAKSSINFSVYIWEDGALSDRILDALTRKQAQGVEVRVLLDGLGGRKAPDDRFAELKKLGGRVEKFRMPKFGTWTRFHRRNHRRAIVIDGRVGFTGGMAVADQWLGDAQDADHWRDTMFKLTGPLANSLEGAFADEWASSSGELLVGPRFYSSYSAAVSDGPGIERFIHKINSPADDAHSMEYLFVLSILAARQRVYLTTPYFIPDKPTMRVLEETAKRGVDIRLLLPGHETDNQIARYSGQSRYDDLLAAGVRIYEYQPTFIHAKTLVVDGAWSIVGSANFDSRSRQLDEENVFGIMDAQLGKELEAAFLTDLRRAREVTIETWRRRNPLAKLLQDTARILDQQS
jgi:cardiolipin synthase A/B